MRRTIVASAVLGLLGLLVLAGCEEAVKDDPRYRMDPAMMQKATSEGFATPEAAEVDMVETMAASRSQYLANLEALRKFYEAKGDDLRKGWAAKELAMAGEIPRFQYLMPAEKAMADRRATDSIETADTLYDEAMKRYRSAMLLPILPDNAKLRLALNQFNELITRYPNSDKIDDAAYRAGRIYEHFRDFDVAARYYQRTFQWNELTPYPARFRAAYMLDQKLHDRQSALELYRLAVQAEARYEENTKYAQERILILAQPAPALEPAPAPK